MCWIWLQGCGVISDQKRLGTPAEDYLLSISLYQFQNIVDSNSNKLKQWSLWSRPSESSSFVLPLAALAWKPRQSREHCGRSANGSHGEKNKQRTTHAHIDTHILKTCVATPLASSAVLQSKETPDLFHHQALERAPFFCTTCLCRNTLYSSSTSYGTYASLSYCNSFWSIADKCLSHFPFRKFLLSHLLLISEIAVSLEDGKAFSKDRE